MWPGLAGLTHTLSLNSLASASPRTLLICPLRTAITKHKDIKLQCGGVGATRSAKWISMRRSEPGHLPGRLPADPAKVGRGMERRPFTPIRPLVPHAPATAYSYGAHPRAQGPQHDDMQTAGQLHGGAYAHLYTLNTQLMCVGCVQARLVLALRRVRVTCTNK